MNRIKRLLSATFAAAGMFTLCNCACCKTGAHAATGEKGASACATGSACSSGTACCAAPKAKKG